MIEMTYKGNSKDKGNVDKQMIPKNIRQIGEVGKERKVYLEDYAVTYMRQVQGAILLGEIRESQSVQYVFVNGAVRMENAASEDADWERIYQEVKEHFEGREIIGYYRKMDEEPAEVTGAIEELFRTRLSEEGNILILHDMPEDEDAVFLMENGLLKKQTGYYIYYEKNQAMQDYMVDHGQGHSVEKEGEVSDKAIQNFRKRIGEKKEEKEERIPEKTTLPKAKTSRFLYAASTFMVLVIAVIGVTIMNNNDKMNRVESTLADMAKQTEATTEKEAVQANAGQVKETDEQSSERETEASLTSETQSYKAGEETQAQAASSVEEETGLSTQSDDLNTEAGFTDGKALSAGETGQETEASEAQTEALAAASTPTTYQASYTVKAGDTLANICRMYYGNVEKLEEICRINGITDPNTIIMGQKIVLP